MVIGIEYITNCGCTFLSQVPSKVSLIEDGLRKLAKDET